MTATVDRSPPRLAAGLTLAAGVLALGAGAGYSWVGVAAGGAGFLALLVGMARGERRAVDLGALGLLAGVFAAGTASAPVPVVLGGTVATVLAWDVGGVAVDVGHQLGRAAPSTRAVLGHATATAAVGGATAAVGYGLFRGATGSRPFVAVVALLAAATLLVSAFR